MVASNLSVCRSTQTGFTLIELIMVIVILGILSAFALPRFADFADDAEQATIEGARGAIRSSSAIARAQFLAEGNAPATVNLEGIEVVMTGGYPSANDAVVNICDLAGIDAADYTCTSAGDGTNNNPHVMTITLVGSTCNFTYTEPDADGDPAAPAVGQVACP